MPIEFRKGDMFSEPFEAIVNTVNCVGVMGKGVALEFKRRWPENFEAYKKLCKSDRLRPGQMFVFDTATMFSSEWPRFLINFPTKDHWRSKSKLRFVEDGLETLAVELKERGIRSVAIPPLGCGNGGLDWREVRPLIVEKLASLEDIQITVFSPWDARDEPEHSGENFPLTFERAILLKALGEIEQHFDGSFDRISLQKITYFLQTLGVNFRLDFARNRHGPYAETLKRSFEALEEHGMIAGFRDRSAHVTNGGYAQANEFLKTFDSLADSIVDRLDKLVAGYESPYGLELLSSVHWLATHEHHSSPEAIVSELQSWTEQKAVSYSEDTIRVALQRLAEDGLISI